MVQLLMKSGSLGTQRAAGRVVFSLTFHVPISPERCLADRPVTVGGELANLKDHFNLALLYGRR